MNDCTNQHKILEDKFMEAIDQKLSALRKDLTAQYTDLSDQHDETQEQLKHLQQSIESWIAGHDIFLSAIKRAFPKDDEGNPDYDGHRGAHLSWISNARDEKEVMEYVRAQMDSAKKWSDDKRFYLRALAVTVSGAVLLWAGSSLWVSFLKGPIS